MVSQKTGTRGRNSSGEAYSATQGELAERALSVLPPPVAAANLPGALAGLNQSPQGYPPRHYPEAVVKGAREDVSFHSKCKVWGQCTDTVQQFKEPGQRSVPQIF